MIVEWMQCKRIIYLLRNNIIHALVHTGLLLLFPNFTPYSIFSATNFLCVCLNLTSIWKYTDVLSSQWHLWLIYHSLLLQWPWAVVKVGCSGGCHFLQVWHLLSCMVLMSWIYVLYNQSCMLCLWLIIYSGWSYSVLMS